MFKRLDYDKIKAVFFFLSWGLLLALIVFFFNVMNQYKLSSSNFIIKDAEVIFSDGTDLKDEDAFRYLDIRDGDSIFEIDPKTKIEETFKKRPEILKLSIHKEMPDKIKAYVKNRTSLAQVYLGRYYPIDSEGFVLPFGSNFRIKPLPLIKGLKPGEITVASKSENVKIEAALKLLELIEVILNDIDISFDIDVSNIDNINILLSNDIKVKLGREGFEEKLKRLKVVLEDIESKGLNPAGIDLRFDNAVLIPR
jgi:cell division septal protein FtsQ